MFSEPRRAQKSRASPDRAQDQGAIFSGSSGRFDVENNQRRLNVIDGQVIARHPANRPVSYRYKAAPVWPTRVPVHEVGAARERRPNKCAGDRFASARRQLDQKPSAPLHRLSRRLRSGWEPGSCGFRLTFGTQAFTGGSLPKQNRDGLNPSASPPSERKNRRSQGKHFNQPMRLASLL